ncbi:MAG: ABC transporter substrate-binding protein [Spirochaetia bacterium]|nr:ABC transporter substrate-binding protein [Spirochaetia bacterium]
MIKRFLTVIMMIMASHLFALGTAETADFNWQDASWEEILEEADGTEVSFHMWGGDSAINEWIEGYVAEELKKRYNVTLNMVPMNALLFVDRLLAEKEAGRTGGSIDLMWINGENFKRTKEAEALLGPFAHKLPNFNNYVDPETAKYDSGYPTNGYEVPYGQAQFVFEYDSAADHGWLPESFASLPQWVRENPGMFTYPEPSDFTGSAFIRQVFIAITGGSQQYLEGWDPELYEKNAPLLWEYLNDIAPYLWQRGRSYPRELSVLDSMFERGEVAINMNFTQANAQSRIIEGRYPETVRTFVMEEGTISNSHFTAIAFNAPNPAGALVLSNLLLDPAVQASKNDPANWGDFTVLDMEKLSPQDRARFDAIDLGEATLSPDELKAAAVQEIPSEYLEALQNDWFIHVLEK